MLKKYRVCELSKDLSVPNKEIVKLLKESFNASYNHMTALKPVELDTVFEHYTNKFKLENFDDYFEPLKNRKLHDVLPDKKKKIIKSDPKNLKNLKNRKIDDNKGIKNQEKKLGNKQVIRKNKENKLDNKIIENKKAVQPIVITKQPLKRINTK